MTTAELSSEVLKKIPIFAGLSEGEARQLAAIADELEFAPGEVVLEQGAQSQQLWILLAGTCEVCHQRPNGKTPSKPVVLATLEPYSNFGEMSFFRPAPHSASVRAQTAVKLLAIERARYDALACHESLPACKLAINTVASLAERLRRMDDWVDELLSKGAAPEKIPEWSRLRATLFDGWKL
ncbi:MAG TPA: cyclic nucleotide-binding domain-containing protein [Pirellulales bacterium]|nr:cyclic nucleotide-binding domain-containing protein [Pirellulales bacterium]